MDFRCHLLCQRHTGFGNHFTTFSVNRIFGQSKTCDTIAECKLFIEFITSHFRQIISSYIEEHTVNQALGTIHRQRFTRTQFFIQLQKTILIILRSVFGKTCYNLWFFTEQIQNLLIGPHTKSTNQNGNWHLTVTIHTHIKDVIGIRLVFQPRTTVWNNRSRIQFLTNLVVCNAIIDSWRTNQLTYDNTFSTIDNESTGCCHKRQISHENVMLADFFCFFIMKSYFYFQRCSICRIPLFTSFNRIFYLILAQFKSHKLEAEISIVIRNRGNITKNFI